MLRTVVVAVAFFSAVVALAVVRPPTITSPCLLDEAGDPTTEPYCVPFYAAQTVEIGTICVKLTPPTFTLTYLLTVEGWTLDATHAWAGLDPDEVPKTRKGNLIPGRFPYESDDAVTSATVVVTTAELALKCPDDFDTLYFSAHAEVSGVESDESAWTVDPAFDDNYGSWGTITSVPISCDCTTSTCTDGVKNGGEDDVDCGGACEPCLATCVNPVVEYTRAGLVCAPGPLSGLDGTIGPLCAELGLELAPASSICAEDGLSVTAECVCTGTCYDGLWNQGEVGPDCGGPCPQCPCIPYSGGIPLYAFRGPEAEAVTEQADMDAQCTAACSNGVEGSLKDDAYSVPGGFDCRCDTPCP